MGPLLTAATFEVLARARRMGEPTLACSLDLGRSVGPVAIGADSWASGDASYPYASQWRERTVYYWDGAGYAPVARYTHSLVKLVPTDWGPPTFEIDGIKMLPTAHVSPYADAERKVALVEPKGRRVLDTCAGLGYFAACCLAAGAAAVTSIEVNPDVLWLRTFNPWSPPAGDALELVLGDAIAHVAGLAAGSVDAILHDPPRFGIAGGLYAQAFYDELARVLRRRGRLFHYTGTPNRLTSGRDVPREVALRLKRAGFTTRLEGDGVLAVRG